MIKKIIIILIILGLIIPITTANQTITVGNETFHIPDGFYESEIEIENLDENGESDSANYMNANGDYITIITLQDDNMSSDEAYIDSSDGDRKTINGAYGIENRYNGDYMFLYLNDTKYIEIQVSNENYLKEIIPPQNPIKENLTYGNLTLQLPEGFTKTTNEFIPSIFTSLFNGVSDTMVYNYKNPYGEFITISIFNNSKIFDNIDDTWSNKTINDIDGYYKKQTNPQNIYFFTYQKDSKVIEIRSHQNETYLNDIVK